MQRLATALVLLALLWLLLTMAPAWVFFLVALLAISAAAWECYSMLERPGAEPFKVLGVATGAALLWSFSGLAPHFDVTLVLWAGLALTLLLAMGLRSDAEAMLRTTVHTIFPVIMITLTLGYLVRLRALPEDEGGLLLLLLFAAVTSADTAAYYVGRRLGRHKLAPTISPKKTWEGVFGGLAAGVLGAVIARVGLWPELSWGHTVLLGLLLSGSGVLGDLAESILKRACGFKDSSRLLPGHGGLMDRTDSLLFAAPVLYYYNQLFL